MTTETAVFKEVVTSEEELRAVLGHPSEIVRRKVQPALDASFREFIALAPYLLIATANTNGQCDVSPRGDAPGFVLVIDDKHIVIPERRSNKRADTLTNILVNPNAGLIFIVPGRGETLRVNGQACIIRDKDILAQLAVQGKVPDFGIGITIEEAFLHCAKAFKRSKLWEPETWPNPQSYKTMGQMLECQVKIDGLTAEDIDVDLQEAYRSRLY